MIKACRNLNDITKEDMVVNIRELLHSDNANNDLYKNLKTNIIDLIKKQNEILEKLFKY